MTLGHAFSVCDTDSVLRPEHVEPVVGADPLAINNTGTDKERERLRTGKVSSLVAHASRH